MEFRFEDYIGRFGIGMLSCFMVTDEIVLETRSAKDPSHAYVFNGRPDGTYSIQEAAENVAVGTKIHIRAKKGMEMYFDEEKIAELVAYYGLPLPFPVMMHGAEETYRINTCYTSASGDARESILDLGRRIFDSEFLDYIPLESKSGLFSGVAYIMPHAVSMHAKNTHRIYLKNMLLTEDGSAILPKWSFFVRCFLNTSKLRPTASRESFYEDEILDQAREELSQCISDYLIRLSRRNPDLLQQIIHVHFLAIKSMAAEDDTFFNTFIPFLEFETNMGQMNGKALLARRDPIGYTTDMNQFHRTSALMFSQNQLLVNACYVHDTGLLRKMMEYDSSVIVYPLRLVSFEEFLQEPQAEVQKKSAAFLNKASSIFDAYDCNTELKCFSPAQLPVFYHLDENAQTMREINRSKEHGHQLFASMLSSFAREIENPRAVLYLNWNNPLIQRLIALDDMDKAMVCLEILYVQSLLTGRYPMQGNELSLLNDNLIQLIEWGIA